jgi:hypothetical protein
MDKQLRWSRIEILERGPARARVRWSYALNDMRYRIFHGDTRAEEIYTVYPDGVAVREVVLWPGTRSNHGGNANLWQVAEWILINAAGTSPLECLELPAPFTLRSGCGEVIDVPWPLPAENFEPFCGHYPQVAEWPLYVGTIKLRERPNPFLIICKNQALFPYMPCSACKGNHPYFNLFPGKHLYNIYKHWPVTDMEDFLEWVPAGDDVGKVATHTSFMDVNFALRRSSADYIPTPDQGATWYMLVGATARGTGGYDLEELAHGYQAPAAIDVLRDPGERDELHRGRVLLEGYDFALRAYVLRKTGADRVRLVMRPSAPQINPVFVIDRWQGAHVRVCVDGQELHRDCFAAQVNDGELTVWVAGRFAASAEFAFFG